MKPKILSERGMAAWINLSLNVKSASLCLPSKEWYPVSSMYINMKKSFSKQYIKASETNKMTAIAIPGNDPNFAILHVHKSWTGKRLWVMTQEYYDNLRKRTEWGNRNSYRRYLRWTPTYVYIGNKSLWMQSHRRTMCWHAMYMLWSWKIIFLYFFRLVISK